MADIEGTKLIASIVLNGVAGDSRVLKTAKAAETAGHRAILFGLGTGAEPQDIEIEGTRVILVRNPIYELKKRKIWSSANKPFHLLVDMAADAITDQILRFKPDLVHSHDMLGLKVGAIASRALAVQGKPVPWVHDLHEYVAGLTTLTPESVEMFVEYERLYLRQADHLITVSPALAEAVTNRYLLKTPPTVILNAPEFKSEFDESEPDVKTAIGLPRETKLVVYVGGAKTERGCDTIVKSVASLPDVHLCFVSNSDSYIDGLRQVGESLGMGARFHTHPYVASDKVTSFIRTADVGTHGLIHYPNGEVALPNKLFEYLQASVPMALSDVASMKGFIDEHKVGRVFEAENIQSCTLAIRSALHEADEIRGHMTTEKKQFFSWQTQAKAIGGIYASLLVPREKRTAAIVDNRTSLTSLKASRNDAPVIYVGSDEPAEPVDIRIDPTLDNDLAGVATRLAEQFSVVDLVDSPEWPESGEWFALAAGGIEVTRSGRTTDRDTLFAQMYAPLLSASAELRKRLLINYETARRTHDLKHRQEAHAALLSIPSVTIAEKPTKAVKKPAPNSKKAATAKSKPKAPAKTVYGKLLTPYRALWSSVRKAVGNPKRSNNR